MSSISIYKRLRNLPLFIALAYYLATVLLSILGPVKYFNNSYKYWIVLPFMLGVCIMLGVGYYLGRHAPPQRLCYTDEYVNRKERKVLRAAFVISIGSLVIELVYLIGIGHFAFGLSALGDIYNARIEDNSNITILIRFLSSFFRMVSLCIGFYRYKSLPRSYRFLLVIDVFLYLMVFLFGYGNQKGASDIVIYLVVAIYVFRARAGRHQGRKAKLIIAFILVCALLLFSYMQYMRYEPLGITASNFHQFSTGEYYFDTNHIVFRFFGEKLGFGMASIFSGYLSQGYYGLSLCMQLPFEWTYGVGSSYALTSALSKFGISGIFERTYLNRMTETFGRHGLRSWNTIFPWLASDYTWFGAMFFFIVVGYILAKSWKEVLRNDNIISYLAVVNIFILVLFTPANNQLFHGYDSFISTWMLIFYWLFFRRRYMHGQQDS